MGDDEHWLRQVLDEDAVFDGKVLVERFVVDGICLKNNFFISGEDFW
jgi:hypothetical protein